MEGKRRIWSALLTCSCLLCCTRISEDVSQETYIVLEQAVPYTRAADPDEELISDLSLMIFGSDGCLEEHIWIPRDEMSQKERLIFRTTLLKGKTYGIYACCNIGYEIKADSLQELKDVRCHLVYPDEYREGIPMAGWIKSYIVTEDRSEIRIPLERIMSKISLRMDRGGLSDGVSMNVVYARIGNCPKSSFLFRPNSLTETDDRFQSGFRRNETECTVLNSNIGDGISGSLSMYMLENMQGNFSEGKLSHDDGKVFDDLDRRKELCSYMEIGLDYHSPTMHSGDKPLIYRFYLGSGRDNLDVERNCHYHITIIPEDDGLSYDSWRIDKSGLTTSGNNPYFNMTPSGYIQGNVGETIHVRCSFHPSDAPFDIGMEELEYDRERGIYDFVIDSDRKGVSLTLKNPGTGILYMTAGSPVNETGMLVIEVNNIKNDII